MTLDPTIIDGGLSLADARERMFQSHARHLPVYVGGHLVGILSDRDLARSDSGLTKQPLTVEQACTPTPYVVGPDTPLVEVVEVLADQKFGAALVMSEGQLLGIFTVIDALRALVAHLRPVTTTSPDATLVVDQGHDHGHDPRHDALLQGQIRHDNVAHPGPGVRIGVAGLGGDDDLRSDTGRRAELRRAATTVLGRDNRDKS